MLHFVNTSLLEADSQTVVNTVNTVGVMGKGLAKHFANKYPEMYSLYKNFCDKGLLETGKLWLWKTPDQWILNFPTKKHWRNPSKLEYIEAGLAKFVENYEEKGIREISFPRLGCGNGGLDWAVVRPVMEKYLSGLPINVYIHDFQVEMGSPEHKIALEQKSFRKSFDAFIDDIDGLILQKNEHFKTIDNQEVFEASLINNANLEFRQGTLNPPSIIPKDDVYEAWQMLIHGPITERRLVGAARDKSIYFFSLLASLPYTRAIEISQNDSDKKVLGIELIESLTQVERLTAE